MLNDDLYINTLRDGWLPGVVKGLDKRETSNPLLLRISFSEFVSSRKADGMLVLRNMQFMCVSSEAREILQHGDQVKPTRCRSHQLLHIWLSPAAPEGGFPAQFEGPVESWKT